MDKTKIVTIICLSGCILLSGIGILTSDQWNVDLFYLFLLVSSILLITKDSKQDPTLTGYIDELDKTRWRIDEDGNYVLISRCIACGTEQEVLVLRDHTEETEEEDND